MYIGKTVFAQLMKYMPEYEFQKCVDHYKGDYRVRQLPCREHFLAMNFAQLTGRESLRDIENFLSAFSGKLYHSGISKPVSRSTLADANEKRDWRIYADFAQTLGLTLFEKTPIKELFNNNNLIKNLSDENQFSLWNS